MQIKVNPDKEFADDIRKRIRANGGYCLCALVKDLDHKCICKEFLEQTSDGYCHCNLYYKETE